MLVKGQQLPETRAKLKEEAEAVSNFSEPLWKGLGLLDSETQEASRVPSDIPQPNHQHILVALFNF